MTRRKPCWFHKWGEYGYDGFMSTVRECVKCGWFLVFNGIMDEEVLMPPGSYRQRGPDE